MDINIKNRFGASELEPTDASRIIAQRYNITLVAVILGVVSVCLSLLIGAIAYHQTFKVSEARLYDYYSNKAKMIVAAVELNKKMTNDEALGLIETLWASSDKKPADEYLCIVDSDCKLIGHTAAPQTLGNYAGKNILTNASGKMTGTLGQISIAKQDYIGRYVSSAGQNQLAAFAYIPSRGFTIGIHRSHAEVVGELRSHVKAIAAGYLFVCGLLVPLAFAILYRMFSFVSNKNKAFQKQTAGIKNRLYQVLDLVPHKICAKDSDGRFILANTTAASTYNMSPGHLVGLRLEQIEHDEERCEQILSEDREVLTTGKTIFIPQQRIKDFKGNERVVQKTKIPFTANSVPAVLMIEIDITDRIEAEQKLHQSKERAELMTKQAIEADRSKSEFLANMSHEIRTPMNAIIGFSDVLSQEKLSDEHHEYVEIIRTSGEHLLLLINDILDFSKIEAGKLETEIMECSIEAMLDEVDSLMRSTAQAKGLKFNVSIACDLPATMHTDPGRVKQCLINLVSNAVKFTEHGHVNINASLQIENDSHEFIRFDVEDTGIGIDPEKQKKIFNPFTQSDSSTTRQFGGTGLGLTISNQLTELLGGKMSLTSTPQAGSVFTIILPIKPGTGNLLPMQNSAATPAN